MSEIKQLIRVLNQIDDTEGSLPDYFYSLEREAAAEAVQILSRLDDTEGIKKVIKQNLTRDYGEEDVPLGVKQKDIFDEGEIAIAIQRWIKEEGK